MTGSTNEIPMELGAVDTPKVVGARYQTMQLIRNRHNKKSFSALDLHSGETVCVRIFNGVEDLHSLENTSSLLLGKVVSHVPQVLYHSQNGSEFVVITKFIPGVTLKQFVTKQPLRNHQALKLLSDLSQALIDLSKVGVSPRYFTPEHIVVSEAGDSFTLVNPFIELSTISEAEHDFSFAAPELFDEPDVSGKTESSQAYVLGAVTYFSVTGILPFTGCDSAELKRNICLTHAPLLRALNAQNIRSLEELLERTLKKKMSLRYQTLSALNHDARTLHSLVTQGNTDPKYAIGTTDFRTELTTPSYIVSGDEILQWRQQINLLSIGKGSLILLEALSGGGKSRLLEEFEVVSRRMKVRIIRGQGLDQAAKTPFQMLEGLAAEVMKLQHEAPEVAQKIKEELEQYKDALCTALPQLTGIFGSEPSQLGPEAFGENRNLLALSALVDALGTQKQPLIVLLDDCQWADDLTLRFLKYWQHRSFKNAENSRYTCILASFRSEEVADEHLLRSVSVAAHIRLAPLNSHDVTSLACSMAGPMQSQVTDLIFEISKGSPFMVGAVLRGLIESGTTDFVENVGWVQTPALYSRDVSTDAAGILVQRLLLLAETQFKPLALAAVWGKEFELQPLSELLKISIKQLEAIFEEIEARNIILSSSERGSRTFVHDKLREAMLTLVSVEQKETFHLLIANYLQKKRPHEIFKIAFHFDAAGKYEFAFPYALQGAHRARAQHSLELAEQQYRIALRGQSDTASNVEVLEGLGDVLMLRGQYPSAQECFEKSLELLEDNKLRAAVKLKLGELFFKRGEINSASTQLEDALRLLGRISPKRELTFLVMLIWEAWVQMLHTLFPRVFLSRLPESRVTEDLKSALRIYSRLAYTYWFGSGKVHCAWSHLRGMNLGEKYLPSLELAQAYSEHAPVTTLVPYFSRGIEYAQRSYEIRLKLGDVWGQGQSLHFYGVVLYGASRFHEAIEKCAEATRLLEKMGDKWEENTARWHSGFCHYRLGNMAKAREICKQVYREALDIDDLQASGISLWGWAAASGGKVPKNYVTDALKKNTGDAFTEAMLLQALAMIYLYENSLEFALKTIEQCCKLIKEKAQQQEYCLAAWPLYATCLRKKIESTEDYSERTKLLKDASHISKISLGHSKKYKNNLPHALREEGYLQGLRGNLQRARHFFQLSLEEAKTQNASYERCLSDFALTEIETHLKLPNASERHEQAKKIFLEFNEVLEAE